MKTKREQLLDLGICIFLIYSTIKSVYQSIFFRTYIFGCESTYYFEVLTKLYSSAARTFFKEKQTGRQKEKLLFSYSKGPFLLDVNNSVAGVCSEQTITSIPVQIYIKPRVAIVVEWSVKGMSFQVKFHMQDLYFFSAQRIPGINN